MQVEKERRHSEWHGLIPLEWMKWKSNSCFYNVFAPASILDILSFILFYFHSESISFGVKWSVDSWLSYSAVHQLECDKLIFCHPFILFSCYRCVGVCNDKLWTLLVIYIQSSVPLKHILARACIQSIPNSNQFQLIFDFVFHWLGIFNQF